MWEIKRLRNFQNLCPQNIKLLCNISLSVQGREEDFGKNYTKIFREKVEPPSIQQEVKFIYCYEFHSSEDWLFVAMKTKTENLHSCAVQVDNINYFIFPTMHIQIILQFLNY